MSRADSFVLAIANLVIGLARRFARTRELRSETGRSHSRRSRRLIAIIEFGGGFIPAIAILFAATSAAFGRRAVIADLIIGAVLALIVFLLFSKLLTLSLPMGPLERLL